MAIKVEPVTRRPIRVIVVECGGLTGDLIRRTVARHTDISIVADVTTREDLPRILAGSRPDVVIWHLDDDGFLGGRLDLFTPRPPKVLAALDNGRVGALWELLPVRTELGELSPGLLLETIRAVAG